MEFIIILVIAVALLAFGMYSFSFNMKKLKEFEKNDELDYIASKYPDNIEMCKSYLKMIGNDKVKIESDENIKTSLYIAISDKIIIAKIKDSYTRIQTIAHECLHSIQDRKLLMANFYFSNFYILFFITTCVLAIFKTLPNEMLFLTIFVMLSMIYCLIRNFLENDAMIKARFLAERYMKQQKISTDEEINKMTRQFDELNNIGVKSTNYYLYATTIIKVTILCTIFLIF